MIGLKSGEVNLCRHSEDWKNIVADLIANIKTAFGDKALDVQHVGSTSIKNIQAKPMLDIAIGVKSFDDLDDVFVELEKYGVYKSPLQIVANTILCAVKESKDSEINLGVPHIVIMHSKEWYDLVLFRDYMNEFPEKAKEYENIKIEMARLYPHDRTAYMNGKHEFIDRMLVEAREHYKIDD